MTDSSPTEAGVQGSVLRWLNGVDWEPHGLGDGHSATVLDECYERQQSEGTY